MLDVCGGAVKRVGVVVVLYEVNDVRDREHAWRGQAVSHTREPHSKSVERTSESRRLRVPQWRGHDPCMRCRVSLCRYRGSPIPACLPFCSMAATAFLTTNMLSSTMSRKLTGKTSYELWLLRKARIASSA